MTCVLWTFLFRLHLCNAEIRRERTKLRRVIKIFFSVLLCAFSVQLCGPSLYATFWNIGRNVYQDGMLITLNKVTEREFDHGMFKNIIGHFAAAAGGD